LITILPPPPAFRNPNNYLPTNVGGGPYLKPAAVKHDGVTAIAYFFGNDEQEEAH